MRICPIGGLCLGAIAAILLAGVRQSGAQTLGEVIRDTNREANGTIIVEGSVVDGGNQPLTKVRVSARRSIASGLEGRSAEARYAVNGNFALVFEGNRGVSLDFYCEGYHYEHLDFSFVRPRADAVIDGRTHTYRNVRVVMKKIGKLATLHEYSAWLKHPAKGDATVWDIAKVGAESRVSESAQVALDGTQPPQGVVYAAIVPAGNTMPALLLGDCVFKPAGSAFRVGVSDGLGGGLCLAPPVPPESRFPMRGLLEAPEAGYVPFIDLSDQQILDSRKGQQYYFYFKLNGFYGKGQIVMILFHPDRGLEVRMTFRLQPDGSRNVETTQ